LELDPENVDALAYLAFLNSSGLAMLDEDRQARLAEGERKASRALLLAPNHAFSHLVLGIVYVWTNRAVQAISEFEHAIRLDRNLAFAHSYLGVAKQHCGRAEETEGHVLEALRISPRDRLAYLFLHHGGISKIALGADEEAVTWQRRSIEANRSFSIAHFILAAALGHLGRIAEARAAAQVGLLLAPGASITRYRAALVSDNPIAVAQRERILDGLRKAGLPEE
jgi:tetratricopeptide (TPR) repeat protein